MRRGSSVDSRGMWRGRLSEGTEQTADTLGDMQGVLQDWGIRAGPGKRRGQRDQCDFDQCFPIEILCGHIYNFKV